MRELVNMEFDLISGGSAWHQLEPVETEPVETPPEPVPPKSTGPEFFDVDIDGDGFADFRIYRQPDGSYF